MTRLRDNTSVRTSFSYTPWVIAFIEGFSTLAVEVIAIRLAVPVVGSSITLTGVMLGIVLLALSGGYWRGGVLSARWDRGQTRIRLARNLLFAAVLYGAVAFPFEAGLLEKALDLGMSLPVAIGVTGSLLFLLPIYLASQTVPMLAELTNTDGHAGKASGKVLFYSTMGSVAGGIVTPVWLFPTLGVGRSTFIVCGALAIAAAVMAIGHFRVLKMAGVGAAGAIIVVVAYTVAPSASAVYAFDSAYQSVRIVEEKGEDGRTERILLMGGSRASGIYAGSGETSFAYVLAAEQALAEVGPENVLVIGAAGFTFPRDVAKVASVKRIDAVDVDPVVKYIAEEKFLQRALPGKIRFLPLSARYAVRRLRKDGHRYGFTLVDAYFGKGIPDELVTVEFFRDIREVSERTAVNVVMDREMESDFAKNLLASFREAFGAVWVKDVKPGDEYLTNVLVTDWKVAGSERWGGGGVLYRDDRNSAGRDHVELMW